MSGFSAEIWDGEILDAKLLDPESRKAGIPRKKDGLRTGSRGLVAYPKHTSRRLRWGSVGTQRMRSQRPGDWRWGAGHSCCHRHSGNPICGKEGHPRGTKNHVQCHFEPSKCIYNFFDNILGLFNRLFKIPIYIYIFYSIPNINKTHMMQHHRKSIGRMCGRKLIQNQMNVGMNELLYVVVFLNPFIYPQLLASHHPRKPNQPPLHTEIRERWNTGNQKRAQKNDWKFIGKRHCHRQRE